jgi:hypothetical protein
MQEQLTVGKLLCGRLKAGTARSVNQEDAQRALFPVVVLDRFEAALYIPGMSLLRVLFADVVPPFPVLETNKVLGFHWSPSA